MADSRPSLEELIKEVSSQKLDCPCRQQDLLEVALLTPKWRDIAPFLGFEKSEEEAIVSEHSHSILKQKIELFTRWHAKAPQSATYRKLIKVFYKLGRTDLAEQVVKLSTQEGEFNDEDLYTIFLRRFYRTYSHCTFQWPPIPHCEYIKLTLIKEDEVQRRHDEGSIQNPENIVELENILMLDEADRKLIVVEGVPGIGKSTFALNACQRWAKGTLFEAYDRVILVELRDPVMHSAKSLADILPCRTIDGDTRDSEMAKKAAEKIVAVDGEKTLFIVDGWDVFPSDSRKDSLIQKLLFNPQLLSVNMSTILITSRPDSSADLHRIASSRVRIFGFTPVEVREYFTKTLKKSIKVDKLFSHLCMHTSLDSSCYIPLNAAIIVHVFLCLGETLPKTLHDAFCALVLNCIIHDVSIVTPDRKLKLCDQSSCRYSLSELPSDLKQQLNQIALLAYNGSRDNKTTFAEKDLEEIGLSRPFPTLGLLQSVESFTLFEKSNFYNFMHSSVQQFLTALHISQFPPIVQANIFDKSFSLGNFSFLNMLVPGSDPQVYLLAIFQYFAGFTELKGNELHKSVLQVVHRYKEVRHGMLIFMRHTTATMRSRPFLSLVRCLYEAQNESLCKAVASQLEAEINLTHVSLSPYECVSVGYLLHFFCSNEVVSVILSYANIDSYRIGLLCKEFSDCEGQKCGLKLYFGFNKICAEGAKSIAQLLLTQQLVHLDLSFNSISDIGADHIANALESNTSLLLLKMNSCGITDEGMTILANAVSKNCTLQELSLSKNPFTDTGLFVLSASLQENRVLRTLKINPDVDLRMKKLLMYNPTLSDVTSEGLQLFVVALADHKQLTRLDIGEFGFQDEAVQDALKLVNEQRKEKGIQVLTLFCSEITLARFP